MRYAVTGGAGFIGSAIVRKLLEQPDNEVVICYVGNPRSSYLDEPKIDQSRVDFWVADVRDRKALEDCFAGVDGVFHCAAYSKITDCIKNPDLAIDVNVKGTMNVLLAAKKNGVGRVVYSASASVYGENDRAIATETDSPKPMNAYGSTKYFGEVLCRQFASYEGVDTVSLRYYNVFGSELAVSGKVPFPGVVERFLYARIHSQPLTIIGDGQQQRSVVSVDDVVVANLQAMRIAAPLLGDAFNISSGKHYSTSEIAEMIGGPTISIQASYLEPHVMCGFMSKAAAELKFKGSPYALEEFIARMKKKYNI
ncbi:MAG: UDP-glucose 4-epimerase [Parcubacteria group bacterium Gr01-1014_3]|nr:MAG: UDP-glucose 4-epimerase [Parcubacteria group bacterium Gr01-1014_3]